MTPQQSAEERQRREGLGLTPDIQRAVTAQEGRETLATAFQRAVQGAEGAPPDGTTPTQDTPPGRAVQGAPQDVALQAQAPSETPAPLSRSDAAKERHRQASIVKPSEDNLFTAIAKLGGFNRAEAESHGLDLPKGQLPRVTVGGRSRFVIHKNGRSLDGLAELLDEAGYPVQNEQGNFDANVLLDLIDHQLRGEETFAAAAVDKRGGLAAEDRRIEDEAQEEAGNLEPPADPADDPFLGNSLTADEYPDDFVTAERRMFELHDELEKLGGNPDDIIERGALQDRSDQDIIDQLEEAIRERTRETSAGQDQGEQGQRPHTQAPNQGPSTDLFGETPVTAQALADRGREKQRNLGAGRDQPPLDSGAAPLFTQQDQTDLTDVKDDTGSDAAEPDVSPDDEPQTRRRRKPAVRSEHLQARRRAFQAIIDKVSAGWENAPSIVLVELEEELPVEPTGDTVGLWTNENGGTVYIVLEHNKSAEEAVKTLFEEVIGHQGIRGVLGDQFDSFLDQVAKDFPSEVAREAKKYGLDIKDKEQRREAAEEFLGTLAQSKSNQHTNLLDRIIVRLAKFLRKLLPDIKLTRAEIRALIAKARGFIERRQAVGEKRKNAEVDRDGAGAPGSFGFGEINTRGPVQDVTEDVTTKPPGISRRHRTDVEVEPGETIGEAYQRVVGKPAWDAIAEAARNILGKVKLADTAPKAFKQMMRGYRADVLSAGRKLESASNILKDLSAEERALISDYIEGEMKAGITPLEHIVEIAQRMVATIERQAESLVQVGMLSPESREFYRGRYLARFYAKHIDTTPLNKLLRRSFHKIDGARFKARGLFEFIPDEHQSRYEDLGWQQRGDGRREGEVLMWRDYTKEERERMGEIRDAAYRFVRGYMESAKDLAAGRLFQAMADDAEISSSEQTERFSKQVPNDKITGSRLRRYGAMSGKWVEPEVWDELAHMAGPENALMRAYLKGLSLWKEGKTSMNPVVHSNNIVSNFVMADFADIPPWRVDKYRKALKEYRSRGPMYEEAIEHGLFGTEFYGTEIAEMIPALDEFRNAETLAAGVVKRVVDKAAKVSGARAYRRAMGRWYQAEDQFFKLLVYMDRREQGWEIGDSIDEAERYFFNYADLPQGARVVKSTVLPFFSYSYKAAPTLLHTAVMKPWKFAKWISLFGGINWAAFLYLYGDDAGEQEEDERLVMDEYMRGQTALSVPFTEMGVPKSMRLPVNDDNGEAMYLDLSRRMPLGDVFDMNNQMGGIGIPQPLMPNNPVLTLAIGLIANKDSFSGRELVKKSDTDWQATGKRARWVTSQVMPNTPLLPGSFAFNKVMNGVSHELGQEIDLGPFGEFTGKDFIGREQSLPRALAATATGFKIRTQDTERNRQKRKRELNAEQRELSSTISFTRRDNRLTQGTKDKRIADARKRISLLSKKIQELRQ